MQNTQTISTNKIIVFLVFICAAIMTSLFLFHIKNKPAPQQLLPPDVGMLFATPRDIKSFELLKADNQKFTQEDFYNHWTLLFFGFTHCSSVCPTTLDVMKRVYEKLHAQYPTLQVVLVSVDPERDTPDALAKYTHSYNPDFIGVTGKIENLRKLQSQLGIFSARDNSTTNSNYQVQHTSSIMLINPQGKWAGLFKYGLNPEQLAKAFVDSTNSA